MTDPDEQLLQILARRNWMVLVVLVGSSLFWRSANVTLGVAGGGLLAIFGYHWRYRALKNMLADGDRHAARRFQFGYLVRLVVFAASIYILIVPLKVHPLALVVGLSVVMLNILVTTLSNSH